MTMAEDAGWYPNQYLYLPGDDESEFRVARVEGDKATLQIVDDFAAASTRCGASMRATANRAFALNALMDPGSRLRHPARHRRHRQDLLALAAGLAQTMASSATARSS